MMSGGMQWLLLFMMVSLSRGRFCDYSKNCSCSEVSHSKSEIRCPSDSNPKFVARIHMYAFDCQVECRDAISWSEFGYQSTLPRMLFNFTIERCPLPDKSFGQITERFSLGWLEWFTFTSHMNLSSTLTRRHFSMLSYLKSLTLKSNGLTELPADLFRDLGQLEYLDLSFNKIAMLPHDILHGLSRLVEINLSYNAMQFVDWKLFGNCTTLNELSLRGNLLTSLDHRTFRNISGRYRIDLAENLLETLPPDVFNNAEWLELDISGNRFSTLPEEFFSQTELTELTLGYNCGNLTTLPMNFLNNLTNLEQVNLMRNNLTSLPENIFWASFSVWTIDLHGNALSALPENIFRDSRELILLNLSDNGLTYLPEGLFEVLSKLQELDLSRNDIASLSGNIFENLDSLRELNLGFNKITRIQKSTFRKLPKIRLIRLSHNFIDLKDTFHWKLVEYFGGPTINKIFLDHNNLTGLFYIDTDEFEIWMNLKFVNLTYNQISDVWIRSPPIGYRDVEYDLRHNDFDRINVLELISSRMSVLVDDNPLDCGCDVYDSLKYMHKITASKSGEKLEIILGNASCSAPSWMEGIPVASLQSETFTCRAFNDYTHTRCAKNCDCSWRPHDQTRIVNCSSRHLGEMPDEIMDLVFEDDLDKRFMFWMFVDWQTGSDWHDTRIELDLANNLLTEIPTLNASVYKEVELLVLSYNNISRLSFAMLPPQLKMLRMDHNDLKTMNATAVEAMMTSTFLEKVDLEGNPWNCRPETRNGLATLEEKFGRNVTYSFDMTTCLESRQSTSSARKNRLYISFARF